MYACGCLSKSCEVAVVNTIMHHNKQGCVCHYWTIKTVDDLGEDFDETVLKWKEVAEGRMKDIEVVNE